ncbi:leucine-rich repeat-containing protein typical subtype [Reticulomyxa filosa]|uniref:Leucine-rich repeat-containing protein typical subtype n=1 Tax=Reticulomyxa filosa TaxID=46433 RepID=X6NYG1_RETFI|nr:leucine-rich repeat-containing protein typical subtype [Reticulomyxa filosa]|eukprot:ETO30327.1 leucine-rich repeat-containing protein typical subtype [Reticulomyxa filosa]
MYQKSLRQCLNTNLGSWLKPHRLQENISLEIIQQAVENLNPLSQISSTLKRGYIGFHAKRHLYILPQQITLALSLYHGLKIRHAIGQLNELQKEKVLCDKTIQLLKDVINRALEFRIKTQMHYKSSCEWMYQPNTNTNANTQMLLSEVQPYRLNSKEQDTLKQMYLSLLALYQNIKHWNEKEKNPLFLKKPLMFKINTFDDILTNAKFNEIDEAIDYYKFYYCLNPHDMKMEYLESIVNSDWAMHCIQSNLQQEILEICKDLIIIPEERLIFIKELEIHEKENFNAIVIDKSQLCKDWLQRCQQEIETYHPQWNIRIQQWKTEKGQINKNADESIVEWLRKEQSKEAFSNVTPISRCQLFTLLRPAFNETYKQRKNVLETCEKELGIDIENNKSSLSRLIDVLIMKHRDLKMYQHIYQLLDGIQVRIAFRQILTLRQKENKDIQRFLDNILTILHRLPDKRGETTFWKEENKRWKNMLEELTEDRIPEMNEPTFTSSLLGNGKPLKKYIINQLLDESGKLKKGKIPIKLKPNDLPVICIQFCPEMPGINYLIEQFYYRIINHGICHSELACLKYNNNDDDDTNSIPILCSEIIHGSTSLQQVFDKELNILNKLDHQNYTELLFIALLINPKNDLPINYVIKQLNNEKNILININNNNSNILLPDWIPNKNNEYFQLQIKTILFCFDYMHQPINLIAKERFLLLDAKQTLESIFRDAQVQNDEYKKIFSSETTYQWNNQDNSISIPIPFKKGDASAIHKRWLKLRTLLQHYPDITGLQCLIKLHPKIGAIYNDVLKQYKDPVQRLNQLERYQLNRIHVNDILKITPSEALTEINQLSYQQQQLEKISEEMYLGNFKTFEEILSMEHQSLILKGDSELALFPFYWNKLSDKQQLRLLQIIQLHPFQELSLRGIDSMNIRILFSEISNLTWLDISNTTIEDKDLSIIAKQCQTLQTLIAKSCSQLQGKLSFAFPSLIKLILDQSSLITLSEIEMPKLISFRANNCKQLKNVEILFEMPYLKQWKMINATALTCLMLKAPNLESLQLNSCCAINKIETGSAALSILAIQGCTILDSTGLAQMILPNSQSKLKQLILTNTSFPTIIQCCPQALFLHYHPLQNDLLLHQIEVIYYDQCNNFHSPNQSLIEQIKHNTFQFLIKFDKMVNDIMNNEQPINIIKCLKLLINNNKQNSNEIDIVSKQLQIASKDQNSTIRDKASVALMLMSNLNEVKTISDISMALQTVKDDNIWMCSEIIKLENIIKHHHHENLKLEYLEEKKDILNEYEEKK